VYYEINFKSACSSFITIIESMNVQIYVCLVYYICLVYKVLYHICHVIRYNSRFNFFWKLSLMSGHLFHLQVTPPVFKKVKIVLFISSLCL